MRAFLDTYLPPREGEIVLLDGTVVGRTTASSTSRSVSAKVSEWPGASHCMWCAWMQP